MGWIEIKSVGFDCPIFAGVLRWNLWPIGVWLYVTLVLVTCFGVFADHSHIVHSLVRVRLSCRSSNQPRAAQCLAHTFKRGTVGSGKPDRRVASSRRHVVARAVKPRAVAAVIKFDKREDFVAASVLDDKIDDLLAEFPAQPIAGLSCKAGFDPDQRAHRDLRVDPAVRQDPFKRADDGAFGGRHQWTRAQLAQPPVLAKPPENVARSGERNEQSNILH